MTTKFIGLKEMRQGLTRVANQARKQQIRYIVLRKNEPLFELRPLSKKDLTLERFVRDIEEAKKMFGPDVCIRSSRLNVFWVSNMPWAWQYTKRALKDLQQLDRLIASRILKKIKILCSEKNPLASAKPLRGPWKGLFRYRMGEYRIIFRKDSSDERLIIFIVLRVKHRKEAYE